MARAGHGGGPVRLGDVLTGVVSRLGLERNLDDYRIWAAWDEVVGPAVARNAQPLRLDTRRLVVAVKNATWMNELSLLRHDLCRRLNDWMGRQVVSEIFLVVGRIEPRSDECAAIADHPTLEAREPKPADLNTAIERLWKAVRERDQT